MELEIEKTYLVKKLPAGLKKCKCLDYADLYFPYAEKHPHMRLRKRGDVCELTKKVPVKEGDASRHHEHTISLTKQEFDALSKIKAREIRKTRYFYPCNGKIAEIDIFKGKLKGLAVVDFEFKSVKAMKKFKMPDFCLADVTDEPFLPGGILCKKTFAQIKGRLKKFGYKKIN